MSAAATLAGAAPDVVSDWHSIDWKKVWHNVRRLQARIVKAVQEGRWTKVRSLVYLLTHSFAGRAAAILRVTTNAGYLSAGELIERLNPKIRGWALYHRHASSARTFARVDDVIFKKLWRWARRRHRHKSARWVKRKYFTRPGDERWRFHGTVLDKEGGTHTVLLFRARSLTIRRHVKIRRTANPYDPAWELYFEERLATQMTNTLTGRGTARYLWLEQNGKCLLCGQPLTLDEGWHVHHLLWRTHGGTEEIDNLILLHPNCHRQVHSKGLVVAKAASREGRS